MKEFDEIDDLFSSAFAGAESTPTPKVKENIDAALFSAAKGGYMWVYSVLIFALICGGIIAFQSIGDLKTSNKLQAQFQDGVSYRNIASNETVKGQYTHSSNVNSSSNSVDSGFDKAIIDEQSLSTDQNALNNTELSSVENELLNSKNNSDIRNDDLNSGMVRNSQILRVKKEDVDNNLNNNISNNLSDSNKSNIESKTDGVASEKKDDLVEGASFSREKNDIAATKALEDNTIDDARTELSSDNKIEDLIELLTEQPKSLNLNHYPESLLAESSGSVINSITIHKLSPWSIAFYGGIQGAVNSNSSTDDNLYTIKENLGLDASLEVNYAFNSKFGLGAGIDYNQRKTYLRSSIINSDSVSIGGQWVINNPNQPDTLWDSTYVEIFDVVESITDLENITQQSSIGIPLYLTYTLPISQRFKLRVAVGARFSFDSFKAIQENSSLPVNRFSTFGVNAMIRPEITYALSKVSIGVYGKVNYDLKHTLNWDVLSRKRYGIGGGVVLRYKF